MKLQDFLDDRSPEYLETVEAIQRGELPPLFADTRVVLPGVCSERKPIDGWAKTIKVIRWIVSMNYRQWCGNRKYYLEKIKGLDI